MPEPALLLASSLASPRAQALRLCGPGVAALAVGAGSMNPKTWPCEDSALLAPLPEGAYLAAVADAHWGGRSGEVIIGGLVEAWTETSERRPPRERLLEALRLLDLRLRARGRDASETTALLVHVAGRQVAWANVGDSLLYVARRDGLRLLNDPLTVFVGGRPLLALPPPSSGAETLEAGDLLLLASDGVLSEASDLEPHELLARLVGRDPLSTRVEALLRHQNERGRDNLGVVALEIA